MGGTEKERNRELGLGYKMRKDSLKCKKKSTTKQRGLRDIVGVEYCHWLSLVHWKGLKSDCVG